MPFHVKYMGCAPLLVDQFVTHQKRVCWHGSQFSPRGPLMDLFFWLEPTRKLSKNGYTFPGKPLRIGSFLNFCKKCPNGFKDSSCRTLSKPYLSTLPSPPSLLSEQTNWPHRLLKKYFPASGGTRKFFVGGDIEGAKCVSEGAKILKIAENSWF